MELKIHIFCGTYNFYELIKKSLSKESYVFECTEVKDNKFTDITKEINYNPGCIIVDKDIGAYFRDEIVNRFSNSKIILLPSFKEFDLKSDTKNVFQISEPFKLSELRELLKEIYLSKQGEEFTE